MNIEKAAAANATINDLLINSKNVFGMDTQNENSTDNAELGSTNRVDTVELSNDPYRVSLSLEEVKSQNKSRAKAKAELDPLEALRARMQEFEKGLEDAAESGKAMSDTYKTKLKCLQIAMNIIKGGRVPVEDKRYLLQNEPEMYFNAIILAKQKENAEKCESVLGDDEKAEYSDGVNVNSFAESMNISPQGVSASLSDASSSGE